MTEPSETKTRSDSGSNEVTSYEHLTPDVILDAIDAQGFSSSGSLLALNSYENRVYQLGLYDEGESIESFLIAKFYRPCRWSNAAILEEHQFSQELANEEIPVIAPLMNDHKQTLHEFNGYRFALFPRRGGRAPELDHAENLKWLGRFLGRIHSVGSKQAFKHRQSMSIKVFGEAAFAYLIENDFIPAEIKHNYQVAAESLIQQISDKFDAVGAYTRIRLHGDCHPGNILWTDKGPHFVDLDDCMTGPAIQDLWMLLSGSQDDMQRQLAKILEGYEMFRLFDPTELVLIEALRALRILNYSAWLARRWDDSAFPLAFPWFNTPRYWEDQLFTLREQQERLEQPVLKP